MFAALALVPAAIGVIAPAGPDDGCPSPRQVADTLAAHLPGSVIPLGQTPSPSALRLAVATDPSGVTRLDLVDQAGETLLRRALSPTERSRGPDCPALAETVALIVERYWREVGYDVPPLQQPPPQPPPPAPLVAEARTSPAPPVTAAGLPSAWRWSLAVAAAGRTGAATAVDASALVAFAVEGQVGLRLSAGVTNDSQVTSAVGDTSFRRFPLRLGGYLPVRLGPGQLEPGLGVDLDAISVGLKNATAFTNLRASDLCSGVFCASPGADLALGWSMWSTHHVYFRALARAGAAAPYRFVTQDGTVLWSTPRTYVELAIECGSWFK